MPANRMPVRSRETRSTVRIFPSSKSLNKERWARWILSISLLQSVKPSDGNEPGKKTCLIKRHRRHCMTPLKGGIDCGIACVIWCKSAIPHACVRHIRSSHGMRLCRTPHTSLPLTLPRFGGFVVRWLGQKRPASSANGSLLIGRLIWGLIPI